MLSLNQLGSCLRRKQLDAGQRIVLELDLSHGLASAPPSGPLEALRSGRMPGLREVVRGLRRGAGDDHVVGLIVHTGTCPLTLADADELGAAIAEFTAHKPSIAFTESFGELSSDLAGYRIALNATQIWMGPAGGLGLVGVHLSITLLRGLLEKLGLNPEFGQRQEYKSAAEQFAGTEVSEANREMMQRIADDLLANTVERAAAARSVSAEAVHEAVARAPLTSTDALAAQLIDRIGYRDEVYAWATEHWPVEGSEHRNAKDGKAAERAFGLKYVHRYTKEPAAEQLRRLVEGKRDQLAVVDVHGGIVNGFGRPRGGEAGADAVNEKLRAVGRQDRIKAVVLRVDSPGGSYIASDAIRREVLRLRESGRPVVASMGSVAASGGYFVAMGADEIVANPSTLTGSIGVLAGKMSTDDLREKIGVKAESIDAGEMASMMSALHRFTAEQWDTLNTWLDAVYADFTEKAAQDRGLDLDVLEPLARGRVWTGSDAHRNKLVDHLGGLDLAVDRACDRAGLDRQKVALHSASPLEFLEALRPADSSESKGVQAGVGSAPAGAGGLAGPEAWFAHLAELAGIYVPHGVLSLPSDMRLG